MQKFLSMVQRIKIPIRLGAIFVFFMIMPNCKGAETAEKPEVFRYRYDVEVIYELDTNLVQDQNANLSNLRLEYKLYDPGFNSGAGMQYNHGIMSIERTSGNTYKGVFPRVFIQTENLAAKHYATIWIAEYGQVPTGDNISIDGAYDSEVQSANFLFRIK